MKYFLVVCTVIAAVTSQEWQPLTFDKLIDIRTGCIAKTKLSSEDVENLNNHTYTESMKPYVGCFARESGIWDDATGFNVERAVQQYKFDLPEDKVREILTKCVSDNKKEGEKTAYDCIVPVQKCLESSEIGTSLKGAFADVHPH